LHMRNYDGFRCVYLKHDVSINVPLVLQMN
jgi:hypothetical protein